MFQSVYLLVFPPHLIELDTFSLINTIACLFFHPGFEFDTCFWLFISLFYLVYLYFLCSCTCVPECVCSPQSPLAPHLPAARPIREEYSRPGLAHEEQQQRESRARSQWGRVTCVHSVGLSSTPAVVKSETDNPFFRTSLVRKVDSGWPFLPTCSQTVVFFLLFGFERARRA